MIRLKAAGGGRTPSMKANPGAGVRDVRMSYFPVNAPTPIRPERRRNARWSSLALRLGVVRLARPMFFPAAVAFTLAVTLSQAADAPVRPSYRDIDEPPHRYRTSTPKDRFSRTMDSIASDPGLDRSSEKAFLVSLLQRLKVPASSQTLVFSTTSLQLRFISPSNPRAIYFTDDLYLGYIPGGRIEVVSLDPELGAIFYIFDLPRDNAPLRFERSERCMNCHASDDTGYVPGLVIKSVVPGPTGGSLDAFRQTQSGHGIPFSDRFGGWHVTGRHYITNHWGNLIGRFVDGEIVTTPNPPGTRFSFAAYPIATSDILAHLLHEHQVGFVNRVVEAGYRARTALHLGQGRLTSAQTDELEDQARIVVRYLLFVDEVPLPGGGIEPDRDFERDFLSDRRPAKDGRSLKDLQLRTRLFQHRCSYMIYSPVFTGLPGVLKTRIYERLGNALREGARDGDASHLPPAERSAIRGILQATLPDLPAGW